MGRRKSNSRRRIRQRLFEKDKRCIYCFKETVWVEANGGKLPENCATLEHIISRLNPLRFSPDYVNLPPEKKYGIACYKCNYEKGREAEKEFIENGKKIDNLSMASKELDLIF